MKFLYPEFLWALFAVLIPIIVHLFNFKKFKKEYFSDISLLKEVKLETKSKSKLKHLLVLITRVLAIVLLVSAFSQPYLESENRKKESKNIVGVYLDNSFSMDAKVADGYLFDKAKNTASEIVQNYSPTDGFQLLTNDFEGRHQRVVSQDEMIKLIEEVQLTSLSKDFNEIYEREKDLFKNSKGSKQLFWLSDFQKNNFDLNKMKTDSSLSLKLIPFKQEGLKNLYIDSVWFTSPLRQVNQDEVLNVRIVNKSDDEIGTKVNLKINKETKGIVNTRIEANSVKVISLNYSIQKRGEQLGKVYLSDYPDPTLTFDDEFLFSYTVNKKSNLLYISDKSKVDSSNNVLAVFSGDENFKITTHSFTTVDYSKLSQFALIVIENAKTLSSGFQNELKQYLSKGGSVLLVPGSIIDMDTYKVFFSSVVGAQISNKVKGSYKVGKLNRAHQLYDNVFEEILENIDLPRVSSYYPTVFQTKSRTSTLLSLQNDSPFLSVSKIGKGNFYFLSASLSESSFSQHALFVPTLLRISENSTVSYPLFYELGNKGLVEVNQNINEGEVKIKELDSEFEFIPEVIKSNNGVALAVHDKVKTANHYLLYINNEIVFPMTYNYNRLESSLSYYSDSELNELISKNQLSSSIEVIEQPEQGNYSKLKSLIEDQKYWRYFVMGALLLLLVEVLLIRLLK
jgi:hypothetical protein